MTLENRKQFRKFLIAFFQVLTLIILGDLLIGKGLEFLYKRQKSGLLYRTNYVVDSTKADFLIFGSSRALYHYNTFIIEQQTHLNVYNCGHDGTGLIYTAALVNAVVERYKPKFVILDIQAMELSFSEEGKLTPLLPYYKNDGIRKFVKYNSFGENLKNLSSIYPYNSLLTTILVGLKNENAANKKDYKGYIKLLGTTPYEITSDTEKNQIISDKVKIFNDLLKKLNDNQIKFAVIMSPFYFKYTEKQTKLIASKLCSQFENGVFLDFVNDPDYSNPSLFYDESHLNAEGSALFTNDLLKRLKWN